MIGGMISSTLLTLIVIPAVFGIVRGFGMPGDHREGQRPAMTVWPSEEVRRVAEPAG
jgi:Cu(I)/Ag(I) efflux system membrane protein CusA/SilA